MARDKRKKNKKKSHDNDEKRNTDLGIGKSSDSSFKSFLKKRAPIYLGIVALFLVFIVPELTKGSIDDVLPELATDDRRILDVLMSYSGPDESGLTMKEAISERIVEELGDRIYSDKNTIVDVIIEPVLTQGDVSKTHYNITINVNAKDGELRYIWMVDTDSNTVTSDDSASKHIVDYVKFYD